MGQLTLPQNIIQKLNEIARRENRPVEDIITAMIDEYKPGTRPATDSLAAMDGLFDDNVTDLSTAVRETMDEFYRKKQ